jgi:SAM-dependent methyltransferase
MRRLASKLRRGGELPLPPPQMRQLVGPTDDEAFDNPDGGLVYPYLPVEAYERVFDFGCGCGRVARQLIQQNPRPKRYVGIDLHRGMVRWCRRNLAPHAPGFEFHHHDVFNLTFNPGDGKPLTAPFPVEDSSFTLVEAHSVFTHLTESAAGYYMREVARVLEPEGICRSSWFLLDKGDFPVMQPETNALYLCYQDPSAAVIFDRSWVRRTAREAGLTVHEIVPPAVRNHQWVLLLSPSSRGLPEADFPPDHAPAGAVTIPPMPPDPSRIGLDGDR